jgi:phage tail sheath protein FI
LVNDGWYQFKGGFNGNLGVDDASIIEAYQLYEDPETIDVNIIIDSNKSETVKSALVTLCEDRLDCMLTADCPKELVVNNKGNETVDLRDWRNGTGSFTTTNFNENTSYAALYGNWLEVYDKYNQKYRWIPASGYMAGIYARTDDVAEPWFAPAGLNRSVLTGIRRLAWNAKQGNRDILYSNGINPIVSFAGQGKVVWGQKTMLAKSSAFDRINVRRLFMVLEKAISTAAKYFLFEPNDTATRVLLVAMIEPFLRDVQSRRGIFDFKVICDDSNNTPERIDRNELWCDILIKPTRTAEFIVLNFVATKTGASFEEAAQAI